MSGLYYSVLLHVSAAGRIVAGDVAVGVAAGQAC